MAGNYLAINKPLIIVFWVVMYCNVPATSQHDVHDTVQYLLTIDEILVKAPEKPISPLSFQEITISDNNISATERLEHYLNYVPGLEMQSGALNTNRIIVRGIGSRSPFATSKLRAYLDDIPITDGIGETSIEDINLESITSIEVWKGPFRSAYGANLGGAIRYVSNTIEEIRNQIKTENTVGDYGYYRTENTFSSRINDKSAFLLNQEYLNSDGYRENNKYKKHFGNAMYKYVGHNFSINTLLSHIDLNAQIPSSLNMTDYEENPEIAAQNWKSVEGYEDYSKTRFGINYVRALGGTGSLSSTLYGYHYNSYELRPFNILDDQSNAISLRSKYNRSGANSTFEVGQEIYLEKYKWDIFEIIEGRQGAQEEQAVSKRNIVNLFTEYKLEITPKISLGAGLNLNFTSFNIEDQFNNYKTNRRYDPVLSPRIYLQYHINDQLLTRLDAAHGYSNPGLDESLDPDGTFNELINQEKGWNYDAGIEWEPSEKFKITGSGFLMNVNDIIVNRQDAEGNIYGINAGKTKHKGIEIQAIGKIVLSHNSKIVLRGSGEIADYYFVDFIDGQNDFSGNQLTGVANNKLSLITSIIQNRTTLLLNFRGQSSMPVNDENSIYNEAYTVSGIRFNQDISLGSLLIGLTAEVDNIFDTKYASMVAVNASGFGGFMPRYFYPGLPRNGKFSLKLQYTFK